MQQEEGQEEENHQKQPPPQQAFAFSTSSAAAAASAVLPQQQQQQSTASASASVASSSQHTTNNNSTSTTIIRMGLDSLAKSRLLSTLSNTDPTQVVEDVKACKNAVTIAFAFLPNPTSSNNNPNNNQTTTVSDDNSIALLRANLINAGLIDTVLNFLDQCNTKTFGEMLALSSSSKNNDNENEEESSGSATATSPGDLLECPSSWTSILYKFTLPDALAAAMETQQQQQGDVNNNDGEEDDDPADQLLVKIAERITPMIQCMTNLSVGSDKQFFKSSNYWYPNTLSFVGLILNLFESPKATNVLIENDNLENDSRLLKFLVQLLFVDVYRPEIMKELEQFQRKSRLTNVLQALQRDAAHALRYYSDTSTEEDQDDISEQKKGALLLLGDMPAVDPSYYNNHNNNEGLKPAATAAAAAEGTVMMKNGDDNDDGRNVCFASGLIDIAVRADSNTFQDVPALQSLLWCCFYQGLVLSKDEFGSDQPGRKLVSVGLNKVLTLSYQDECPHVDTLLLTICEVIRFMKTPQVPYWDDNSISSMVEGGLMEFLLKVLLVSERKSAHPQSGAVWEEALDILEAIDDLLQKGGPSMASQTIKALQNKATSIRQEYAFVESQLTQPKYKDELEPFRMILAAALAMSSDQRAGAFSSASVPAAVSAAPNAAATNGGAAAAAAAAASSLY